MIRCASSQLTNITRQCSTLTLKCCNSSISTCTSSGSGSIALQNGRLLPFQSAGAGTTAVDRMMTTRNCRYLSSTTTDSSGTSAGKKDGASNGGSTVSSLADDEWKKFQDSMTFVEPAKSMKGTVDSGFVGKRKVRGGKIVRRQQEKKMLREQTLNPAFSPKPLEVGGGRFPALRYSDDETQRLLDEAHENIPKRTGKRGNRNLKRQRNRWRVIYADRAKRKEDNVAKHHRTMETRSRISGEVKEVKARAEGVRLEEREYHLEVLRKWADMNNFVGEGGGGGEAKISGEVKEMS